VASRAWTCPPAARVAALLDLERESGRRRQRRLDVVERHLLAAGGEHRQAAVGRDRVRPGAQRDLAVVAET
jgi:hypothetical protein